MGRGKHRFNGPNNKRGRPDNTNASTEGISNISESHINNNTELSENMNVDPDSTHSSSTKDGNRGGGWNEQLTNAKRNIYKYNEDERKDLYRNANFEKYYKAQNIIPENEWELFIAALQKSLPLSFRINPLSSIASDVQEKLSTIYSQPFIGEDTSIPPVDPPQIIPWCRNAYQVGCGKPELKKNPALRSFHEWLINLTADGTITRQETVSMIPPLLLRVESHHNVLDMCAAPGSKTSQLIEFLHLGEKQNIPTTGMIIANDADSKRAYMLTHQVNRLNSPAIIVTCHEAQVFPNIGKSQFTSQHSNHEEMNTEDSKPSYPSNKYKDKPHGFFDRILCDVPCSGDGTGRKNADVFLDWTPAGGASLHPLQLQIAMRGLGLLKIGGYMAYSTCSLNPIEDEAVVSELLRRCEGSVELVDVSSYLPELKYSPGISTWKVYDKQLNYFPTFEDTKIPLPGSSSVSNATKKLLVSMFPPAPEIAATYHLNRCMRILPHAQDTGGFFICLLHKKAALPTPKPMNKPEQNNETNNPQTSSSSDAIIEATTTTDTVEVEGTNETEGQASINTESTNTITTIAKPTNNPATSNTWSIKRQRNEEINSDRPVPQKNLTYDSRGRPLIGRYEMTIFASVEATLYDRIKDMYGISSSFPLEQLYTRSESSKSILLVTDPIGRYVISRQHLPTASKSSGLVRIVSTGIKVFVECKGDRFKYPHPLVAAAAKAIPDTATEIKDNTTNMDNTTTELTSNTITTSSITNNNETTLTSTDPSSNMITDYRLVSDGIIFLFPFLTRQVVYVSGREFLHILQYSGQFVPSNVFTSRIQYAFNELNYGSFVIALNPNLDGLENDTDEKYKQILTTIFDLSTYGDLSYYDGSCKPRSTINLKDAGLIPPILRSHYVLSNGQGTAHDVVNHPSQYSSPSSSSSSSVLNYKPKIQVWTGDQPNSHIIVTLWKGITKYNIMAQNAEIGTLTSLLHAAGYTLPTST